MIDIKQLSYRLLGILGTFTLLFTYITYTFIFQNLIISLVVSSLVSLFIITLLTQIDITLSDTFILKEYLFGNTNYSWKPNITHFPFILFGKLAFVINTCILKMIDYLFFV